jgi:nucleoside-diphosphate-sugar epimerase
MVYQATQVNQPDTYTEASNQEGKTMPLKVLFIGGTGIISSACTRLALQQGIELYLLNRGKTDREAPQNAGIITADIRDVDQARRALDGFHFDVVVNWVSFTPEHVQADLDLFREKTGQYIFISSASAYQSPPPLLPVTESTPLKNTIWEYSRQKIACENLLMQQYREADFPVTIVRPSHTYDERTIPVHGRYTIIDRMRKGQKVVIHGDGTSLWTLTHHMDFAKGFVPLLGNPRAVGESVHITSDESLSWNQIYMELALAAGGDLRPVYVPSAIISTFDRRWGESMLGDKSHSMVFDNTKIKRLAPGFAASIPFAQGAREIVAWFDANPLHQSVDDEFNHMLDDMIGRMEKAFPEI